jgi:hypothetical protein
MNNQHQFLPKRRWAIAKLSTNQMQIISRYVNKQDAEDALRFINKVTLLKGQLVIVETCSHHG